MVLKYKGFLSVNEANVKHKIKRKDLKVGDEVMTNGTFDGVVLDYQIGKIIAMREYGNILVEFEKNFSPKLHSGANNIGKEKRCYYIKFENITSNSRVEFEEILNKIDKQKREENDRLNATYKSGDVIVGVGEMTAYRPSKLNIDGEVGIVYYDIGQAPAGGNRNRTYWIGFLDKFDKNLIMNNGDGTPANGAGYNVDKLHLRHITDEEREKVKDKLDVALKQFNDIAKPLEPGDVVKFISDYSGYKIKGKIGVVMTPNTYRTGGMRYITHFVKLIGKDLPDYMDQDLGLQYYRSIMQLATEKEIEANEADVKRLKQEALDYNHPYKVGDWIIAFDRRDRTFDNQPGKIVAIDKNQAPWESFTIEFLTHFSPRLQNIGKNTNCTNLPRINIRLCKDPKLEEMIKKLEAGKVKPFIASDMLITIMDRTDIRSNTPFFTQSHFDLGETVDNITFLPVDKIARLESGENPYKSRFRQIMGVGKFIRMLQPSLDQRQVELLANSFKANYDIIKGGVDKLRLVSGEQIRYWYDGRTYVKGGGRLNGSCMQATSKGPEMQMFVDNPDVIQMLILTDDAGRLLGRALVWRLVEPYGKTYMDYSYTRYDKDAQLFATYGKTRGWYIGDTGSRVNNMVCALFNGKKYKQGKDALDHFDTFHLGSTGDYCTNGGNWTRPKNLVKPKWEGVPETETSKTEEPVKVEGPKSIKKDENNPFPLNARIIYQKIGAVNNNKKGIFVGLKDDGKAKIVFDDGGKYALKVEYLKETD